MKLYIPLIALALASCGEDTKETVYAESPPGEPGSPGEPGEPGSPGSPGSQGQRGPQGPQGPRGLTGAQGPQGDIGPQGLRGKEGPIGPQGLQGKDGKQGPRGTAGTLGPQGEQGPRGLQGIQGKDGLTGKQGPRGFAGSIGPKGEDGKDGRDLTLSTCTPTITHFYENDCHYFVRTIQNPKCSNYSPDSHYWIHEESTSWQPLKIHEYQTTSYEGLSVRCLKRITTHNVFNNKKEVKNYRDNCMPR